MSEAPRTLDVGRWGWAETRAADGRARCAKKQGNSACAVHAAANYLLPRLVVRRLGALGLHLRMIFCKVHLWDTWIMTLAEKPHIFVSSCDI